jgi:hypothetical protein
MGDGGLSDAIRQQQAQQLQQAQQQQQIAADANAKQVQSSLGDATMNLARMFGGGTGSSLAGGGLIR